MQGFLLCAASVALLVGLGALVKPPVPGEGGQGRGRSVSRMAGNPVYSQARAASAVVGPHNVRPRKSTPSCMGGDEDAPYA